MSNLVSLCGSATSPGCHRLCEDRTEEMHQRGMWVRSDEDPAAIPVVRWDGSRVLLLDCGTFEYA